MGKQASETHQLNAGKPLSAQATHERCPETRRPWSRPHPGSAPPAAVGCHADSHYHRACVDHELAARVRRAEDSSVLGARRVVELHSESHAAELRSSGDARSGSRPTGRWSGAPGLRVHLVGHSTGAELVSSALPGLPAFRSIVSVLVSRAGELYGELCAGEVCEPLSFVEPVSFVGRSFSTNTRPALRAAACGGRPRPAGQSAHISTRLPAVAPSPVADVSPPVESARSCSPRRRGPRMANRSICPAASQDTFLAPAL